MLSARPDAAGGGNAVFLPLFVFVLFWSRTDAPGAYAEASDYGKAEAAELPERSRETG